MRRIVYALAAALAITACSLVPAKYDEVEMISWAQIWQQAKHLEQACGEPRRVLPIVASMLAGVELLGAYVDYRPDEASRELVRAFMKLTDGFNVMGSETYCKESAENFQAATVRAMKTLGARSR